MNQAKSQLKEIMSRNNNAKGYHTLYHINKTKNNKSQTISITREKRNVSQEPMPERVSPIPRPWRQEFAEKYEKELQSSESR